MPKWVYPLIAIIACAGCESGLSDKSAPGTPEPSPIDTQWNRWSLSAIPGSGEMGVQLYPAHRPGVDDWCVYRSWPAEYVSVIAHCGGADAREVLHPPLARGELLVLASFVVGDDIILALHDAARNVPARNTGVDLVRFHRDGSVITLAELLPLVAFDYLIYGGDTDAGIVVCDNHRCFLLDGGGPVELDTAAIQGFEIIEAVVQPWGVDALVRTDFNHENGAPIKDTSYSWARIDSAGSRILETIPTDCIPYRLESAIDMAAWTCARTKAQFVELLRTEVDRMPHQGMMEFGASNSEGRIAWGQVYYLNGLMHVTGGLLPNLYYAGNWSEMRHRINSEVASLSIRGDYGMDGFQARRYSINRTPMLFALHLGRIATTFEVAKRTNHDQGIKSLIIERLVSQLFMLNSTVERAATIHYASNTFDALEYAPGIDFWSDGANVPFNYLSSVAHGLLALYGPGSYERASSLMKPLLTLEPVESADTWRYWWGVGLEGWTEDDGVSMNTPSYVGQKGLANITYRSMDASALLMLEVNRPGSLHAGLISNIRRLIAQGSLLPLVNEVAARVQPGPVELAPDVAYHYSRSAAPFEIQSQVWALEQLLRDSP